MELKVGNVDGKKYVSNSQYPLHLVSTVEFPWGPPLELDVRRSVGNEVCMYDPPSP